MTATVLRAWFAAAVCVISLAPARAAGLQLLREKAATVVSHLRPLGRVDGSRRLRLAISLPLRNQPELTDFLAQLQNPKSPNYRKYLTPAQFAEKFGPAQADYNTVIAFTRAHGLTVVGRHSNRLIVDVEGAVSDIEKTFHVTMRIYQHPTEHRQFFAPDAPPGLDLAVPILDVSGLDNYSLPAPQFKIESGGVPANAGSGHPESRAGNNAVPNQGTAPNGDYMGNDFRTAYVPATALTGSGQAVALVEFDGYTTSDITYY